jgi:hypothetical protein
MYDLDAAAPAGNLGSACSGDAFCQKGAPSGPTSSTASPGSKRPSEDATPITSATADERGGLGQRRCDALVVEMPYGLVRAERLVFDPLAQTVIHLPPESSGDRL